MPLVAVSDASALIALQQIGLLERVAPLFMSLTVPPAVVREISPTVPTLPGWVRTGPDTVQPLLSHHGASSLGAGEIAAIALALELGGHVVILDDRAARAHAMAQGLPVIGTVGILLLAKREAIVPAVRPSLAALIDAEFHISPRLLHAVLTEAGESD